MVLRDHMGAFRAGACHLFSGVSDPEVAELLACRRALEVARDSNVLRVHVELDAKGVVHMLQAQGKELSVAGPLVEEIKMMLRSFEEFKVSWIHRSANIAAHKLAKVRVGDELCKFWLGVSPDFVLDVLSDEILNFTI